MKFLTKLFLPFLTFSLALNSFIVTYVKAASYNGLERLKGVAGAVGFSTSPVAPQSVIINIVLTALGFMGLIFLIMILYAGFQWMTAGGNEDKIKEAKKRLQYAIIGLVIIVAAYAIATFIFNIAVKSTSEGYYMFN